MYVVAVVAIIALGVGTVLLGEPTAEPEVIDIEALLASEQAARAATEPSPAALTYSFWVDSQPSGAEVLVDSSVVGTTPAWVRGQAAGPHRVTVRHDGYPARDTVLLLDGGPTPYLMLALGSQPIEEAPRPSASQPTPRSDAPVRAEPAVRTTANLTLTSTPSGALVKSGGVEHGRTPLTLQGVTPGPRSIAFSLEGHEPVNKRADLVAGRDHSVSAELSPRQGAVDILVQPWGTIYIDGKLHARETDVRYRTQLTPGTHLVRVVHPSLGSQEQVVRVRPGETVRAAFNLASPAQRGD